MKPSGIDWIGDIPAEWNMNRFQNLLSQVKEKNRGLKEKNLLSLSYGKIIKKDIFTASGLVPENYDTYNIVKKNDIILRLTDLQNDQVSLRTGIVEEEKGIITSAYVALRANNCNASYYHWLLYAFDTTKEIYSYGQGVRQGLTYEELKKMLIPLFSEEEQQLIADFLDDRCAQIDSIAADLEKQIEILQKYKKSLITETVTKGLDKVVPMKDSGIDWIGEIPEHWDIKRVKDCGKMQTGTTPPSNEGINYECNGFSWYTPSDFVDGSIALKEAEKCIENEIVARESIRIYPKESILFVGIASIGKIGFCEKESYSNQQITAIKPKANEEGKYISYVLLAGMDSIKDNALYTTVPIINNAYLGTVKICIPSKDEQIKICDFLDIKCKHIDELVEEKQKQLETIQQHKKSLIYEYVTGKKRVKEAL